jgi:hypothetical protein
MDSDSLKIAVERLGRRDFNQVTNLLLNRLYGLTVVDVDRKGDGGSDRTLLRDAGGSMSVAFQVTVQQSQWQDKVLRDAESAVKTLGATRYWFLTSRAHDPAPLRALEHKIATTHHIPATCLGANEIADLIIGNQLEADLFDAIGIPHAIPRAQRPDRREILLHSYLAFGNDALQLRESIYDDTLLIALYEHGTPVNPAALVLRAATMLGQELYLEDTLLRRVDSLRARGKLVTTGAELTLAPEAIKELQNTNRLYEHEFEDLRSTQSALLSDQCTSEWSEDDSRFAAILLARCFVKTELDTARGAEMVLRPIELLTALGDPLQDLTDLLARHGVPTRRLQSGLLRLIEATQDHPLVKKLTRIALYLALEGANPTLSIKALGANRWDEVTVIIDASVAIPYLCARLYEPTHGRTSRPNLTIIRQLRKLGARITIPAFYITECAAHLARAYEYRHNEESDALAFSSNGFVAHYFQLRQIKAAVPNTLVDYLAQFSPRIRERYTDHARWLDLIAVDLRPLLQSYDVYAETIDRIPSKYKDTVEREYAEVLADQHRDKKPILIRNDVTMLAHAHRLVVEQSQSIMCATWDMATIKTAQRVKRCGWVVSPAEAGELVHVSGKLSDAHLTRLSHQLAKAEDRPERLEAEILDRVIATASSRMADWEFRKHIEQFVDQLLERVSFDDTNYVEWVQQEMNTFLGSVGVAADADEGGRTGQPQA